MNTFCTACVRCARGLRPHWIMFRTRVLLLFHIPPRIMVIFSGFQVIGWLVAVIMEIFDPSSFSGTVVRVRYYIPTVFVLLALTPLAFYELRIGLADNRRGEHLVSLISIFWWSWLASLMIIVEPKNVAAFTVYAIIALFRAWAFASSSFDKQDEANGTGGAKGPA